jgi:hypothetical protein
MKDLVLLLSKNPEFISKNVSILEKNNFNTIISSELEKTKKRMCLYPPHALIIFYNENNDFIREIRDTIIFKDLPILAFCTNDDYILAESDAKDLNFEVLRNKESEESIINNLSLAISKYKLKIKKVSVNKTCNFRFKTKVSQICEASFAFISDIKFKDIKVCTIKSRFFAKLGFNPHFATIKEDLSNKNQCIASFIALKEEERTSIRKWINKELTKA